MSSLLICLTGFGLLPIAKGHFFTHTFWLCDFSDSCISYFLFIFEKRLVTNLRVNQTIREKWEIYTHLLYCNLLLYMLLRVMTMLTPFWTKKKSSWEQISWFNIWTGEESKTSWPKFPLGMLSQSLENTLCYLQYGTGGDNGGVSRIKLSFINHKSKKLTWSVMTKTKPR